MEFWGVEVKSGKPLKVVPEEDKIIHLSSACLGEISKDKGKEPVSLYVKFGDKKVQLGTLSSEKFPQTSYDLVFEKDFELSHNWKYGSVFFTGYKFQSDVSDDEDEDSDDFDEEDIPINAAANGKPEFEVKSGAKPRVNGAKQKKTSDTIKNEKVHEKDVSDQDEAESSESDSDEDSGEEKPTTNGHIGISEDDEDSDSDEEETPAKVEGSSKRVHESSKKTPVPVKKAKFVTPEKTGGHSGGVHVDTPYPKQALKAAANNKQHTPKSNVRDYSCKPCNRSFKSEDALGSHNKAKHSAK
ncbi:hypothetical protein RYX36_031760 [Vicia faba]